MWPVLLFTFTFPLLQLSHSSFVGSAVIAKLLRMQMLSDDDEFLSSEAAGDK